MSRPARIGIVGGGIAGCTLAHALLDRGAEVVVFDSAEAGAASAVAAGVMNPVSGPRLALVEQAGALMEEAFQFYRTLSDASGGAILNKLPLVRHLRNETEVARADERRHRGELDAWVERWEARRVVLRGTGRLDAGALAAWTRKRVGQGAWLADHVRDDAIIPCDDAVEILGLKVDRAVLADGWRSVSRTWMQGVPFEPAKGHLLRMRSRLDDENVIHSGGVWTCPIGPGLLSAGATYERGAVSTDVNPERVAGLAREVGELLGRELGEVTGMSGVRPVVADRRPVAGPVEPGRRIWCMNGLGSRGSMLAPALARQMAEALLENREIDPRWSVSRWSLGRRAEQTGRG